MRLSALSLSLLALVLLFQNCSQVRFVAEEGSDLLKQNNNGGGYGGKPDGDFYRFTPDFTCENRESYASKIHATDSSIILTENKKFQCDATQTTLDPKQVDASIFQIDVVGYQEGIFEAASESPAKIPANLVEVWCRDSKDWSGVEVITHFDRQTNLAVNRTFYATADAAGQYTVQVVPDFSVSRVIDSTTVTVKDGQDFELIVHRDQPDAQLGLFKGHLQTRIDGKLVSRDTSCRLGGTLDAKVWPVKQIVDLNVSSFKLSADQNYFSYASNTGLAAGLENLYSSSSDGHQQNLISPDLSWSNQNYQFTSDSKKLIYMIDGLNDPYKASLMSVSVDGSNKTVITSTSSPDAAYLLTGDGKRVIYTAGNVIRPYLKSTALDGSGTVDLNPPMDPATTGTFDPDRQQTHVSDYFDVAPIGQRVAFGCCFSMMNLYVTNADGTGLQMIPLSIPSGYTLLGVKFASPTSDQILKAVAWTAPEKPGLKYMTFMAMADGSGSAAVPTGWAWGGLVSPSGDMGLIASDANPLKTQILHLKTGASILMPTFTTLTGSFFTQDSSAYIGSVAGASGPKYVSVSTANGAISEICPGVNISTIREIPGPSLLALSDTGSLLNVYVRSSTQACQLVNSVPVTGAGQSLSLKVSNDGQSILVQRQNQLFYIPLNGRPSFQVNRPVFGAATILSFDFAGNSKSVLYRGDQIQPGITGIYYWSAPSSN